MVKKRCTFKNLEEILNILKTWKKFRKPGENFQKSFGHPVLIIRQNSINLPTTKLTKKVLIKKKLVLLTLKNALNLGLINHN